MFASRMSFAHRGMSSLMRAANSSGGTAAGSKPISTIFCFISSVPTARAVVPHPLWNKDVDVWPRPAGYCPRVDTHGHVDGNGARHRYSPDAARPRGRGDRVIPEGANHQWRKNPPGELFIDPVADPDRSITMHRE
jgi:hypothetical protein